MGSLEYVSMPQNGINPPGVTALSHAFAHNPELRHINLADNTFTVSGAEAFALALPKLTKLETLNLESCLVRTGGAKAIANALDGEFPCLKVSVTYFLTSCLPDAGVHIRLRRWQMSCYHQLYGLYS
mgnify:CR=1 FL=1